MTDINRAVTALAQYALNQGLIAPEDKNYAVNRVLACLHWNEYIPPETEPDAPDTVGPLLEEILDWAAHNGRLESDTANAREILDTELMACLTPRPSEIIARYRALASGDIRMATDYFYRISRASNYIRTDRTAKDLQWRTETWYGDIIITINLSKPEKDPRDIAAARSAPQTAYPKCSLCRENEGYTGSLTQAARGNHRMIPVKLLDETWYLQYSPYVYYNEHCIFLKAEHQPMTITARTFQRLLAIVEQMPHYFAGSNADLPIVGGSILSHEHFQGGRFDFPMAQAETYRTAVFDGYADVEAGLVDWPMSVIRLRSERPERLADLAARILERWRAYTDAAAGIYAETDGTPHNTITPICRFCRDKFELDLVLRNNRTDREHPLGIFHPHRQYHHIKKENIGLIEVMGLAVLPARLKGELAEIERALQNPQQAEEIFAQSHMAPHLSWYQELNSRLDAPEHAHSLVEQSVGEIFSHILENAGVFKRTKEGEAAFLRFLTACNQHSGAQA